MSDYRTRGETYSDWKARIDDRLRDKVEREARLLSRVVRRDPCFKCGTRADIGCIHTRVAA